MITIKQKEISAFSSLKEKMGLKNIMQAPRLVKVVVSAGIGSIKDKKKIDLAADRLAKITGQKAVTKGAKKSIATFKVRQGDPSGYEITLRGDRMRSFLDKLFNIALPRTKDFRGIPKSAIDEMGNITLGIREHTIFPETADEELKDVFGLSVTIVTTARTKKEAEQFLEHLSLPFKKENVSVTDFSEKKKGRVPRSKSS